MSLYNNLKQTTSLLLIIVLAGITASAQNIKPKQPVWWFGVSGAANFNSYQGTTQLLNNNLTVPTAFHKGDGIRPYFSLLTEYRPNKIWGGMLNIGYDNRGGKFDEVTTPCNCAADLSTNLSYVTIEPSLRLAPFASAFYIFAGPTFSFNVANSFAYAQQLQPDIKSKWNDMRSFIVSAQAGAGIDIPVSASGASTQMTLSPFVAFLTNIGSEPRTDQSWALYTIRAGVALKFGKTKQLTQVTASNGVATMMATIKDTTIRSIQTTSEQHTCLVVRENYIPDEVIAKVCNKYGPASYDITKITGANGADEYVVRKIENEIVKTYWISF